VTPSRMVPPMTAPAGGAAGGPLVPRESVEPVIPVAVLEAHQRIERAGEPAKRVASVAKGPLATVILIGNLG
jgi:hypothetical protein